MSTDSESPMEKATRSSPPELSGREKGYHATDAESKKEPKKEESASPKDCEETAEPKEDHKPPPADCGALKIKTSDAETAQNRNSPRNCSQDETDSPASSSRTPLSPQYRHIQPHPQAWTHRGEDPHPGPMHHPEHAPHWYQPPDAHHYSHDQHSNVRLPGIAALLTEPYSPQPMPRMQGDWPGAPQNMQPAPEHYAPASEHYPPMVAALPLDDSRARTPQPMPQRKRGRLPKETTDFLKAWLHSHAAHPYPSEVEKKQMCHATGLSMSQVSNWMINGRRRILGPSYLSTSRSNPHSSPAVTLSSPPVVLSSPSVMLSAPGPTLMLRAPSNGQS
ncbi:hypothetical protein B0H13DRAFT_2653498 [Mycena leptocephala]|nr:hypothetical protein B0H13DRAFT_2653498 [Mycena leptocephala]